MIKKIKNLKNLITIRKIKKKKNKKKQIKLNYTHGIIKNLKKEKMNYDNLISLNEMWQEYMTDYFMIEKKIL